MIKSHFPVMMDEDNKILLVIHRFFYKKIPYQNFINSKNKKENTLIGS